MKITSTTKQISKEINQIVKCLDTEKIYKTLKALDWKWAFTPEITPNLVKNQARELMHAALEYALKAHTPLKTTKHHYSTAGFYILTTITKKGKIYMRISFEVDSWDNYK